MPRTLNCFDRRSYSKCHVSPWLYITYYSTTAWYLGIAVGKGHGVEALHLGKILFERCFVLVGAQKHDLEVILVRVVGLEVGEPSVVE